MRFHCSDACSDLLSFRSLAGRMDPTEPPTRTCRELGVFIRWKRRHREPVEPSSPLFRSRQRPRLSLRQIQVMFRRWQRAAGFERCYPFHALRHTAITNVYRTTRDLYLTQRFARHASPLTTTVYTHPSDEELYAAIRGLGN